MRPVVIRRMVIYGGLAVALVVGGIWAFRPQPVTVDLATVESRPLTEFVTEDGITRVRDLYTVSAPVAGRVNRIDLEVGDPVAAGRTEIATIAPSDPAFLDRRASAQATAQVKSAEAAVAEAGARVEQARATLSFSKTERERTASLIKDGVITQTRFDQADRDWRSAKAALDSAQAALRARKMDLEVAKATMITPDQKAQSTSACCVTIVAPATGQVLTVHQKSSKVVASGTPLIDIGDETNIEVVVDLLSVDAVKVRPNAPATLSGWGGDQTIDATVRRVEPTGFTKVSALGVEEQRVNVILSLDQKAALAAGLGHGYRVVAAIETWASDGPVVAVPIDALFRVGEAWAVFKVVDGTATQTPIDVAHRNDNFAEVTGGLSPGDAVVLHPGRSVGDGTLVAARDGAK